MPHGPCIHSAHHYQERQKGKGNSLRQGQPCSRVPSAQDQPAGRHPGSGDPRTEAQPAQLKDMEADAHKQQCEVDRLRQEAAEASHLLADGLLQAQQAHAQIEEQAERMRDLSQKLQV